jgi:hypothetical protein
MSRLSVPARDRGEDRGASVSSVAAPSRRAGARPGSRKLNLDPNRQEKIRLGGRDILARPGLVADVGEVDRLLMIMTEANSRAANFIPIPRRDDGHFNEAALASAVSYGFRIVRWHPARS